MYGREFVVPRAIPATRERERESVEHVGTLSPHVIAESGIRRWNHEFPGKTSERFRGEALQKLSRE